VVQAEVIGAGRSNGILIWIGKNTRGRRGSRILMEGVGYPAFRVALRSRQSP
jgi:hypothetical protein